jgi:hypothetical protein
MHLTAMVALQNHDSHALQTQTNLRCRFENIDCCLCQTGRQVAGLLTSGPQWQ